MGDQVQKNKCKASFLKAGYTALMLATGLGLVYYTAQERVKGATEMIAEKREPLVDFSKVGKKEYEQKAYTQQELQEMMGDILRQHNEKLGFGKFMEKHAPIIVNEKDNSKVSSVNPEPSPDLLNLRNNPPPTKGMKL